MWGDMRTDWGQGDVYIGPGSVWNFLLVTEAIEPRMAALIGASDHDYAPMHLLATRMIRDQEETLFLTAGRRFVYVTDFTNKEYADVFTEVLALRDLGPNWDGDWTGYDDNLLSRVDERMAVTS